jgi:ATP-dependent RNA helicase DDX54/DBP10
MIYGRKAVFGRQEEKKKSYRDEEFYLSYTQKDAQTEKG